MRNFTAALLILLVTACGTTADILRVDDTVRSPSDPNTIRVLLDEPKGDYQTIAMVKVSDQGWGRSLEELKAAMIKEASKLGGNAVIVGTETRSAGTVFIPMGTMAYGVESSEQILVGKVILLAESD